MKAYDLAKKVAALMGGNGLTTEQQLHLVAIEIYENENSTRIHTANGLLYWEDPAGDTHMMGIPQADSAANACGFMYAERMVHFMEEMKARGQ